MKLLLLAFPLLLCAQNPIATNGGGGGTGGGGTPGGADTAVQYNDGGSTFNGNAANFSFNKTTKVLTVTGGVTAGSGTASLAGAEQSSGAATTLCAGVPCIYTDSTSHEPTYLSSAGAYLGTMTLGIVNPSDSNCVNYVDQAGTQHGGACGISGLTTGTIPEAASATALGDSPITDN